MTSNRLCGACGENVASSAQFCPMCGQRLAALDPEKAAETSARAQAFAAEYDERESQHLSREMFQAHAELLRRMRSDLKMQTRRAELAMSRFDELSSEALSPETTRAVQDVLLDVEDIGDRWEEIQHNYNHESETVDEDFLDRFNELEIDVELPENLRDQINVELDAFGAELETLGESVRLAGARGQSLLMRSEGRWFASSAGRMPIWIDGAAIVLGACIACAVGRSQGLEWGVILSVISPLLLLAAGTALARFFKRT